MCRVQLFWLFYAEHGKILKLSQSFAAEKNYR